jgi:hypothetical protein
LVRPVREQLEHDRIIRLLHGKFRRKYEAGMNPGNEQNAPVGTGPAALFPDLVLSSQDRGHKLQVIVEIETGESVNHLEALAQWAHYGRVRAAFHLYIPSSMVDVARRLTEDNQIHVAEIWSYHVVGEEPRFTLVHRNREAISPQARSHPTPKPAAKPAASPDTTTVRAPKAKPAKAAAKVKTKSKGKPPAKAKKAAPKKKKK